MKKSFLSSLVLLICVCSFAQAQIRMEFNAALNNTPFRVGYGDTLVYEVLLINNDSSTFSGNLFAGYLGSNSNGADSIAIGFFQISPFDTISTAIYIEVTPQYFKEGPEVVVVWPIFNGEQGAQLADFIFVRGTLLSLNEFDIEKHNITIGNNSIYTNDLLLKQVRIFNLSGQLIADIKPTQTEIHLPPLSRSLYVMQCITEQNENIVLKFWAGK